MPLTAPDIATDLPVCLAPVDQRRLYVHDSSVMNDPGYEELYLSTQHFLPERALWLAEPGDMVALARPLEEAYLEYLRALGAGPTEILTVPILEDSGLVQTLLARHQWTAQLMDWAQRAPTPITADTFCTTEQTRTLTSLVNRVVPGALSGNGDENATFQANHKSYVRSALDDLGIPKIPGCTASTAGLDLNAAVERIRQAIATVGKAHRQIIVRADYSSGGTGNLLIGRGDCASLENWLAQHRSTGKFLVDAYLPWRSSPNVQFWLSPEGRAQPFQITDQVTNGSISHIGNVFPSTIQTDPELRRQSGLIADWLARIGVRGFIGIDFIDTYTDGVRFVEVNARVNGSTYAAAIALRINHLRALRGRGPLPVWRMNREVLTGLPNFAGILEIAGDLIYDHGKNAGVVPYWTGAMGHGVFSCVTLAQDAAQREQLHGEFLNRVKAG